MKEKLRCWYSTREQQEHFKVELKTRRRRPDETLQDLCHEIERLAALAYPETTPEMRDIIARDAFIDPLNNNSLEFTVKERNPPTLAVTVGLTYNWPTGTIINAWCVWSGVTTATAQHYWSCMEKNRCGYDFSMAESRQTYLSVYLGRRTVQNEVACWQFIFASSANKC